MLNANDVPSIMNSFTPTITSNVTSPSSYQALNTKGAEKIITDGGGLTDAPSDDKMYVRKNGAWVELVVDSPSS